MHGFEPAFRLDGVGVEFSVQPLELVFDPVEALVDLFEALVDLFEAFVDLFEAFVDLLEALVDCREFFVDGNELVVDEIETVDDLAAEVARWLGCRTLFHQLHSCMLADKKLRMGTSLTNLCATFAAEGLPVGRHGRGRGRLEAKRSVRGRDYSLP
jgi:hypothetical protein